MSAKNVNLLLDHFIEYPKHVELIDTSDKSSYMFDTHENRQIEPSRVIDGVRNTFGHRVVMSWMYSYDDTLIVMIK